MKGKSTNAIKDLIKVPIYLCLKLILCHVPLDHLWQTEPCEHKPQGRWNFDLQRTSTVQIKVQEDKDISRGPDQRGSYLYVINFDKINTAVHWAVIKF